MPQNSNQNTTHPSLYRILFVLIILYSLAIFAYGLYGARNSSGDLLSFHETSELLLGKTNPYQLTVEYIERAGYNLSFSGLKEAGGITMYPPSTHIIFVPFYSFLVSPDITRISWLLWNIVFLVIIYWFISSRSKRPVPVVYKILLVCVLIGASATKTNLSLGQTALFSLAAFALVLFLRDKNKLLAGIALAVAVSKPSLMVLFVFYLLFRKEFRVIAIAFFIHLALTVGVSIWIGQSPLSLMQNYFKVIALLTTNESALSFYYQMAGVSFKTLLKVIGCGNTVIAFATVSLYGSAIAYIYRLRSIEENFALGLIAILTVLVDYHQHYDFVVLFLLFPALSGIAYKKHAWFLSYYLFLMYLPNISRFNFLGFSTAGFFRENMQALLVWQIFYTCLYLLLLVLYVKKINFLRKQNPLS